MNTGVIIGRFQPPHLQHIQLIEHAAKRVDQLIILIGSSYSARTIKNPFGWHFRKALISICLKEETLKKVIFKPIKDYPYSDERWILQVKKTVTLNSTNKDITIFGVDKDNSTYYLNLFPDWNLVTLPYEEQISSTDIRKALFEENLTSVAKHVHPDVLETLYSLNLDVLKEEYKYINKYKAQFAGLSYPPIFQTVDNVVYWRGKILLIKRRSLPGKGLWALPGGFLNADERIADAAIRELKEETTIKIYDLNGNSYSIKGNPGWFKAQKTFDHPERSLRGRTITTAFYWKIPDEIEVNTTAASDAARTQWFDLNEILSDDFGTDLFEDHQSIIAALLQL